MRPRDTRKSPIPRRPGGPPDPLPNALKLHEAAVLANTTPEELWQQVRAGRIRYTLISGERGQGTSVLVATEDLIRIGLVRGRTNARLSARTSPTPVKPQNRAERPSRLGVRAGMAMAAALGLLLFAATAPSPTPTSSSRTIVRAASRSTLPSCKPGSKKKACKGVSASRSGRSKAPQGAVAGSSRSPQPRQSNPSPPSPDGYDVPRNIPSNCSRDVTADLVAWFKRVPNNSTLNFQRGACYRIDDSLVVWKRAGLTFNGNGATFDGRRNGNGKHPHWWLKNSSGITLRNMTVRGANPRAGARNDAYRRGYEWQAAYSVWGSRNVLLDHLQAYDVYGDFVEITPMWVGRDPVTARDITVQNSHFERGGRQGISVIGGEDVLIQDNYLGGVPHDIVDLEPSFPTLPIRNIRFIRNRTGPVWLMWFAVYGRCNTGVSNITIADNVMEELPSNDYAVIGVKTPEHCARRGPFTIVRNTLKIRRPTQAFVLRLTQDALIRANSVHFVHAGSPRILVDLKRSTRARVLENSVRADPRNDVVFVRADYESDYASSGNRRS